MTGPAAYCFGTEVIKEEADNHSVVWDGTDATGGSAGSGVYFCTFNIDDNPVATKKLVLLQ